MVAPARPSDRRPGRLIQETTIVTQTIAADPSRPAAGPFVRLADRVSALAGWRRLLAALALGGIGTLALPPAHAVPLLWLVFPLFLWLLKGCRTGVQAFWAGWFFGFGHFFLGLYWVSFAMLVDLGRYWWLLPGGMAGLPALMAGYVGLAALGLHLLRTRLGLSGLALVVAFALVWSLGELARGHVFTGFPWNLLGYAWVGLLPVLQGVALVGVYGLGLLTVLAATLPALLGHPRTPPGRAGLAVLAGVAGLALLGGWGAWRMAGTEGRTAMQADGGPVRLRVVQPNVAQSLKWDAQAAEQTLIELITLSNAPGLDGRDAVVWPETAVPFALGRDPALLKSLGMAAPPGGLLLAGAGRVDDRPDGSFTYHNSLYAVTPAGAVPGIYDKAHLVPFGEYMPLRAWLPDSVRAVAASSVDTTAGPGPRTLDLPGLPPVSPLICYEVIFPGAVTAPAGQPQPDWLLNVTNDAWYGHTAGPHQHLAITAVRAVEEGVPVVRAANTGISAVVDPFGRMTARLELGRKGVIDADLPARASGRTPFARFGHWPLGLMLAGLGVWLITLARRV